MQRHSNSSRAVPGTLLGVVLAVGLVAPAAALAEEPDHDTVDRITADCDEVAVELAGYSDIEERSHLEHRYEREVTTGWLTEHPGEGWSEIDRREVVIEEAVEQLAKHRYTKTITAASTLRDDEWRTAAPDDREWQVWDTQQFDVEVEPAVTRYQYQHQTYRKLAPPSDGWDWIDQPGEGNLTWETTDHGTIWQPGNNQNTRWIKVATEHVEAVTEAVTKHRYELTVTTEREVTTRYRWRAPRGEGWVVTATKIVRPAKDAVTGTELRFAHLETTGFLAQAPELDEHDVAWVAAGSPRTVVTREADPTPNKVVVSLDGDVAADIDFGAFHHGTVPTAGTSSWEVVVTPHDGPVATHQGELDCSVVDEVVEERPAETDDPDVTVEAETRVRGIQIARVSQETELRQIDDRRGADDVEVLSGSATLPETGVPVLALLIGGLLSLAAGGSALRRTSSRR